MDEVDLARLRREYEANGLAESMLPAEPLPLFRAWLHDAHNAALAEVNAMVVSTVGDDGRPSSRMVLCKVADDRGFTFFTNYRSRKAGEIASHPQVSLLFPWHPLGRQVRVEGVAERVDPAESAAYFSSRPRGAQLSALASRQSAEVADRATLEARVHELSERYADDVPPPDFWGGIRVVPDTIEFWQGRRDRLHDRLVYRREPAGSWSVVRLQP
ncbi:MAG: pyridoxamine 5'-phosphate oxidase [Frankiales bacterium]|nr:pyridoxamine 5'-phosphate oxidase [Frankiales bacterium]